MASSVDLYRNFCLYIHSTQKVVAINSLDNNFTNQHFYFAYFLEGLSKKNLIRRTV